MINLTYRFTQDMGTQPVIYDGDGHLILDATVSPFRVKEGLSLMIHADDPRQLTFFDKDGKKVIWTEGGETHLDLTGDIVLFGDDA